MVALHFFNPKIAEEYGVNSAILLQNISFWIEKNQANDKNYIDGYYWTYSSIKAFQELFPYLTARAISTALQKLEDGGVIITGNHNKSAYDRTKWYAITEKGFSILQNREMEKQENANGNSENDEPIPDTKTDKVQIEYTDILTAFNEICISLPKVQKMTDARRRAIKVVLPLLDSNDNPVQAFKQVFKTVEDSDFLCGRNTKTSFRASFDWIMNKKNILKIIEGNYSDSNRNGVNKEGWGEWL